MPQLATVGTAATIMTAFVTPVMQAMIVIASLAVVVFLVYGGILYTTSSGDPEKLVYAKSVIRGALIGLVIVLTAGTLTAVLSHAYAAASPAFTQVLPALPAVAPVHSANSLSDVLVSAITGLFKNLIDSASKPLLAALSFFTHGTPLMAENPGVFSVWVAMVGIADALFVLALALLGFQVMSFATFGLQAAEFKHLLPKIALIFLLINTSIFLIDAVISLSNAMIFALSGAFPGQSVWDTLSAVVDTTGAFGLAGLLVMVAFLILSVMLMIYYILRLVALYVGAVLAPLALLLWLLPGFKDFVETAAKAYLGTIFVLFIHVVILELAASIFAGMLTSSSNHALNPFMSLIVGLATLLALLKTQSVMSQMSYVSLGPKTATKLGGQLGNVVTYYGGKALSRGSASLSARSAK